MNGDKPEARAGENWLADAMTRFEGSLIRYAAELLGDADRARDVVQDTFLALHTSDRAQVADHLGPWLFAVCRNRAVDVLRKEGRVDDCGPRDTSAEMAPPSSSEADVERHDAYSRVLQVLASLPPRQQEVMRLKFDAELSYREISSVTGLTESNVGYLLHVAMKTIRERLQADADAALGA